MEDKKAAGILINLLNKHSLDGEEKEAVLTAIGILGWSSLAQSRLKTLAKAKKAKQEKDTKW